MTTYIVPGINTACMRRAFDDARKRAQDNGINSADAFSIAYSHMLEASPAIKIEASQEQMALKIENLEQALVTKSLELKVAETMMQGLRAEVSALSAWKESINRYLKQTEDDALSAWKESINRYLESGK